MEDKSQAILKDMEHTRSSMSAKIEEVEDRLAQKVQPMADAVERVTEAAADAVERVTVAASDIVDSVKDTVHGVAAKVEEAAISVSKAFDLSRQADRHPWVVFSAAATTGCILGSFLGGHRRRRPSSGRSSQEGRSKQGKDGNGKSSSREQAVSLRSSVSSGTQKEGVFGETLQHLKGLALGSLMGLLRDMAKRSIPGTIGSKIAEEVEGLTKRMGVEPIAGPVLGEEQGNEGHTDEHHPASTDLANRMRMGGTGPGLR